MAVWGVTVCLHFGLTKDRDAFVPDASIALRKYDDVAVKLLLGFCEGEFEVESVSVSMYAA